jgi:tRNA(Glu) U13 pseudouridine synthase TruD
MLERDVLKYAFCQLVKVNRYRLISYAGLKDKEESEIIY